jgi:ABC-type branched-subunit amino acid transport system substrate-binding protein
VEVLKAENLGLLYSEDSAGLEALAGAEAQMAEYNSKLAAALAVKSGDRDLDARLDALSQAGCQVVLMFVQPVHAVLARERSAEMEYRPIWMTGTDLSDMAAMHKLSDRNWAGTISALAVELPSAEGPLIDEYREAYREYAAQGERWGEFFLLGFGLAEPFVEALRRAGRDLDRESLILQLEAMTGFRGIMGRIGFSPQRRQGSNWMHICQSLEGGAGRRLTGWFEPHWLDND